MRSRFGRGTRMISEMPGSERCSGRPLALFQPRPTSNWICKRCTGSGLTSCCWRDSPPAGMAATFAARSFATGSSPQQVRPCPPCPESGSEFENIEKGQGKSRVRVQGPGLPDADPGMRVTHVWRKRLCRKNAKDVWQIDQKTMGEGKKVAVQGPSKLLDDDQVFPIRRRACRRHYLPRDGGV